MRRFNQTHNIAFNILKVNGLFHQQITRIAKLMKVYMWVPLSRQASRSDSPVTQDITITPFNHEKLYMCGRAHDNDILLDLGELLDRLK